MLKIKSPNIESIAIGLALGFIPKLILYLPVTIALIITIKSFKDLKLSGILSILAGIVSFIALAGDIAALSDLGDDYIKAGHECILEWTWLYTGLIIHFVFYITAIITLYRSLKKIKSLNRVVVRTIDETLFEVTQLVGIVCGLAGIVFTLFAYFVIGNAKPPEGNWLIWIIFGYCLVILIPYFSIILFCIVKLILNKNRSIYDEKQIQDLFKAGFTAWIISIPVMFIFLLLNVGKGNFASIVLWFPFYVFINLFIFSSAAIIYFKKDR